MSKTNLWLIMLFFVLIVSSNVLALDCQYKDNNEYSKEVIVFYENGTKLDYNLLEVKEVSQGSSPRYWPENPLNFKVFNNYNSEVNVSITYIAEGTLRSNNALIASKGYSTVNGPGTSFDESTINFKINTEGLEAKRENIRFDNYTCKLCPSSSNFTCLNDGQTCTDSIQCGGNHCIKGLCSASKTCFNNDCKCNSDEIQCIDNTGCVKINSIQLGFKPICDVKECVTGYINSKGACALKNGESCKINDDCTSGICNQDYKCGAFSGICSEGKMICNLTNKCLTPSTLANEQSYSCEWECDNETKACNGICKTSGVVKTGKPYSCEWECKSGRGMNGVCQWGIKDWTYFGIICILLASVGIWYFAFHKRKKEEGKTRGLKEEYTKLTKDIGQIKTQIKELEIDKEKLDLEKNEGAKEIQKIRDEIKKSNGRAKEILEKKLRDQEERQKDRIESIRRNDILIKSDTERLNERMKFRDELAQQNIMNTKKEIEAALEKYGKIYGKKRVFYDDLTGYIKFENGKESIHRWLYRGKLGIGINQEIHHIDGDKLNNEMWNLIALDQDIHKYRVKEAKIKGEGWKSGLKYLLDNKIIQRNDLHKYIREKAEKEKIELADVKDDVEEVEF